MERNIWWSHDWVILVNLPPPSITHFTKGTWAHNWYLLKQCLLVILFIMMKISHILVHVTIAELLWNVQNCVWFRSQTPMKRIPDCKTLYEVLRLGASEIAVRRWILILAWLSDYKYYKVWDEIICPFPNINGAAVEVCKWISDFNPDFTWLVITYPCWN